MKKLKKFVAQNTLRLAVVACLLLYPFAAIVALPWVWFTNIGQMGYTTLDEWKDGWKVYDNAFTKEFWR